MTKLKEVFTSPYDQMKHHNGKKFTVIRELNDNERDPEVGSMYKIQLEDGEVIDAWPEEIYEPKVYKKHIFNCSYSPRRNEIYVFDKDGKQVFLIQDVPEFIGNLNLDNIFKWVEQNYHEELVDFGLYEEV